jgi:hypothetical protein
VGYRFDEVGMNNKDIYRPAYSFSRNASINSPKGTITLIPPAPMHFLPEVAYSYGQSFHVNDPRIGTTAIMEGSVASKARSINSSSADRGENRLSANSGTRYNRPVFGAISNDTGLQEDEGPGLWSR